MYLLHRVSGMKNKENAVIVILARNNEADALTVRFQQVILTVILEH